MQDAPAENGHAGKEELPGPAPLSVEAQLDNSLKLLDRAVRTKDTRLVSGRLLRQTAGVRSKLTSENLQKFVAKTLPESFSAREVLLGILQQVCFTPCSRFRQYECRGPSTYHFDSSETCWR